MNKFVKKIGAILIITSLVLTMGIPALADENKTSGKCGDNVTWKYDKSQKELVISGKGKMEGKYVWEDLDIKKVKIEEGITNIDSYSFSYMRKMETISIPKTVTTIGYGAFSGSGLKSIKIGENVKKVGNSILQFCGKLEKVEWNNLDIPQYAFYGSSLKTINMGKNVQNIGNGAFEYTEIEEIDIPKQVKNIGNYAFKGSHIKKIILPKGVKTIGKGCFSNCRFLESVKLSSSIKVIPQKAFMETKSLKSIYIKKGVTEIEKEAFSGSAIESIKMPATVLSIGKRAFQRSRNLTTVTIPKNVTVIRNNTFEKCKNLREVKIGSKISRIEEEAFNGCKKLKEIVIPGNVKTIEYKAFAYAGCEKIVLEEGVKEVDYLAFYNCSELKEIEIGSTVTSFQANATEKCKKLSTIKISENNNVYKSIDNCILKDEGKTLIVVPGAKTGTFTIPKEIQKIDSEAFNSCVGIKSFSAGDNANYQGIEGILYDTSGTKILQVPQGMTGKIVIPTQVTHIGTSAFYASQASEVIIPNTVTEIEPCAFEYCKELKEITIPGSVNDVSQACFWGCGKLTKVTIEQGVKRVLRNAFQECPKLKKIVFPNSLTFINKSSFDENNWKITFYCKTNSLAMSFAKKNYYRYKVI